jgi:hypothetical protein
MKRTTYIMLGMLIGGALLVFFGMIYMLHGGDNSSGNSYTLKLGGEPTQMTLPEARVVRLIDRRADSGEVLLWKDAPLTITSTDASAGTLSLPAEMEPYLEMKVTGDTLRIYFSMANDKMVNEHKTHLLEAKDLTLTLPARTQCFYYDLYYHRLTFRNYTADTLAVMNNRNWGRATFENCRFRALNVQSESDLTFASGEVRDLHIRLDKTGNWKVKTDSFHIDTEYLSARDRRSDVTLTKGEARRVVWTPLTEKASLDIRLQEGAVINVQ